MDTYMNDLTKLFGASETTTTTLKHSTNEKAGADLDTTDFLTLMVAMFQNQDIDNTASTTDMLNQLVQVSVIQAISDISSIVDSTSTLNYAASLVGKDVTIGKLVNNELQEIVGTVQGTGVLDGEQVVFVNNETYKLSDILAVGKLPPKENRVPENTEKNDDLTVGDADNQENAADTDNTTETTGNVGSAADSTATDDNAAAAGEETTENGQPAAAKAEPVLA